MSMQELALRRYASLAAVEESERSTEEFYLDLEVGLVAYFQPA